MDINTAKLEKLSKIKKSFNTEHSAFWELVNTGLKEQFVYTLFS